MIKELFRLWARLSGARRRSFYALMALMIAGAVAETVSLAAVIPFLSLMADPESLGRFPMLQSAVERRGLAESDILLVSALIFGLIAMTSALVRLALVWAVTRFTFGVAHDLSVSVYSNTLSQSYQWHVGRNSSESVAAINKVQFAIGSGLLPLLRAFVSLVIAIFIVAALISVDPSTAIYGGLGFAASYVGISLIVRRRIKRNGGIIAESQGTRIQAVQEGLGGIRDVLIDGTQGLFVERFQIKDNALREAQVANSVLGQSPRFAVEGIALLLVSILAWKMALQPDGLSAALPVLGALALGGQKLIPLMQQVYGGWARIAGARATLRDVLDLLELKLPNVDQSAVVHFDESIRLDNISFAYGKSGANVLAGFNLNIEKGSRVGFIGPTGSGKSTVLDIVMGLLEPTSGSIAVDGLVLAESNRRAWQKKIAHVPQAIYLADGSVRENIAFGIQASDIDDDRVKSAAERANISTHIESLPEGYATHVGERGVRLSGGQRQRIGIARALYKQAEVLVLDEATSALDNDTERAVIDCVVSLDRELTILMIAHRLTTLEGCDRVIALDAGRVAHDGSYSQVIGAKNQLAGSDESGLGGSEAGSAALEPAAPAER